MAFYFLLHFSMCVCMKGSQDQNKTDLLILFVFVCLLVVILGVKLRYILRNCSANELCSRTFHTENFCVLNFSKFLTFLCFCFPLFTFLQLYICKISKNGCCVNYFIPWILLLSSQVYNLKYYSFL